jgi:DNA-binding winged helix-turn-helix (wHTH) protein
MGRLRFGDFTLDSEARELRCGADAVHLRTRAFDLLDLLVRHHPRVLGKAEIRNHLWPDTVVEDVALTVLVAEIRAALEDDAHHPRFVRTVHGLGYAFCGEAAEELGTAPPVARGGPRVLLDGRTWPLREGTNILGRDAGVDVPIEVPGVSRRHARVVVSRGLATLEDLGSKNGTFVGEGEEPVAGPVPLPDGSPFRLGRVLLHYRSAPEARSTKTEPGP